MSTTARTQQNSSLTKSQHTRPSTVGIDPQTARLLRLLGETAIRLADGQPLGDSFIAQFLSSAASRQSDELLTIPEACERLRISRWMLYRLMRQRRLPTVTIGRRRLVPAEALNQYMATLSAEGAAR